MSFRRLTGTDWICFLFLVFQDALPRMEMLTPRQQALKSLHRDESEDVFDSSGWTNNLMLSIAQFSCIKKNDSSVAQTVPTQVSVYSRKLNRSSPWETGMKQFLHSSLLELGPPAIVSCFFPPLPRLYLLCPQRSFLSSVEEGKVRVLEKDPGIEVWCFLVLWPWWGCWTLIVCSHNCHGEKRKTLLFVECVSPSLWCLFSMSNVLYWIAHMSSRLRPIS